MTTPHPTRSVAGHGATSSPRPPTIPVEQQGADASRQRALVERPLVGRGTVSSRSECVAPRRRRAA
eukprot:4603045-Prymnesium_polylepis.1